MLPRLVLMCGLRHTTASGHLGAGTVMFLLWSPLVLTNHMWGALALMAPLLLTQAVRAE